MWLSPCGSTFDNLRQPALAALRARYEGTRLGRQELNAELLEDTAGALCANGSTLAACTRCRT
jgi:phage terminase large subunit-like protein